MDPGAILADLIKFLLIPIVLLLVPLLVMLIFDIAAHLGELFGEQ